MSNKGIYKRAWLNVKENFWTYILCIVILGALTGFFEGATDFFIRLQRLLRMAAQGLLTAEALGDTNSDVWSVILSNDGLLGEKFAILGVFVGIFFLNPLSVGLTRVFLSGNDKKTELSHLISPFKSGYFNITKAIFLKNILLELCLIVISLVFTLSIGIIMKIYASLYDTPFRVVGIIVTIVLFIAAIIGYIIRALNVTYIYSMVDYLVAKNHENGFVVSYILSKKMVKGNKWRLFKIDFSFFLWAIVLFLVPVIMLAAGMSLVMLNNSNGLALMTFGVYALVLVFIISSVLTAMKKAAWTEVFLGLYKELEIKAQEEVKKNEEESNPELPKEDEI